jgi:hypothetical protein
MRWKFNVAAQRPQDAGFINSYGDKGKAALEQRDMGH